MEIKEISKDDFLKMYPDKENETIESYIAREFPCTPPCDSYAVCENCSDAFLIRVGAEIQKRQDEKQMIPMGSEKRERG
jgi:hypothetical protein